MMALCLEAVNWMIQVVEGRGAVDRLDSELLLQFLINCRKNLDVHSLP